MFRTKAHLLLLPCLALALVPQAPIRTLSPRQTRLSSSSWHLSAGAGPHPLSRPAQQFLMGTMHNARKHSTQEGVVATYGKYTAGRRRARDTTIALSAGNGDGDSSSSSETQDGGEGDKGEAYVAVQGLLTLLLIIAPSVEDAVTHSYRMRALVDSGTVLGLFLCLLGALLGAAGAAALGEGLTSLPKPSEGGELSTHGVLSSCRHPMYGGLLLASLGLSAFGFSPARLIVTFVLFGFLHVKADKEEEYLLEAFEGYGPYRDGVPNKFFPSPSWLRSKP